MKKLVSVFAVLLCSTLLMAATPIRECKCKGIALYGRVKVVTSGADLLVRVVTSGADLRVQKVTHSPDECGEWQMVTSNADFTVQFVDHGEDFRVKFVAYNPGVE